MDGTQESTYEPLEGQRRRTESTDSPEIDTAPPQDRNGILYIALLAAGIGFVLPYNSFIMATDYWQLRFPTNSVALDMSMTYIIVAFATVLMNNIFLSLFSFKVRILFGYAVSLTTLVFVALCEVAFHMFNSQTAYSVNLVAVSLTAIGCTIQQSSFYGFASIFPKKYTQAVMAGESLAGLLMASTRISIKLVISNEELSTVIFFLTSTTYIALSYVLHSTTIHSPFVRYHLKSCAKIVLRPDEDRTMSELMDESQQQQPPESKYNMLQTKHYGLSKSGVSGSDTQSTGFSFSNPVYELSNPSAGESTLDALTKLPESTVTTASTPPSNTVSHNDPLPNVAFKVEHILTPSCTANNRRFGSFRNGLESRWRVAQAIYPYMVCIALAYCVTISLYPAIIAEIISCNLNGWMPVLLMFMFNTSDVIGKVMASIPYAWSRRQLILLSTMRIALVPLLLLCCTPRSQPIIAGEMPAFIFTAALGITNGLAGSLPMMFAPSKVPATLKEATGNMMTLSYNVGLTAGSLVSWVFESMLGPPIQHPCPSYPYIPLSPSMINFSLTTTTSTSTTTTTAKTLITALKTTVTTTTLAATTTTAMPTIRQMASTLLPTRIITARIGSPSINSTSMTSIAVSTMAAIITSLNSSPNSNTSVLDAITNSTTLPSTILASAVNSTVTAVTKN